MNERTNESREYGAVQVPGVDTDSYGVALEASPKWIRVFGAGECVVNSKNARLMFETNHTPVYYFPKEDVRMELLSPSDRTTTCPHKGEAQYYDLSVSGEKLADAAWCYENPVEEWPELQDFMAFEWNAMDTWYEEDEQVFLHPTNSYHRIDVRESTREVSFYWKDRLLAQSNRPVLLFETGAPDRYYLPRLDVNFDVLTESDTRTVCCYKGFTTQYWSAEVEGEVLEDVAWCYRQSNSGYEAIRNRLGFYQEKLDVVIETPQDSSKK